METLVHKCQIPIGTVEYEVQVFSLPDGRHIAKTMLDEADVVINDGPTLEMALRRHTEVLPLAINSRKLFMHKRDAN
ncbi:MAG: hypothetical protein E4G91_07010 [Candidatus Zixiibacteriota bacterium]|nr:MAG: hypothetical protein E4G91_07010 [candidate division Zixibacteria bacterium]